MKFILSLLFYCTVCPAISFGQTITISGSVSDAETQEPIAGAQLFLSGSTIGTTSDANGNFELSGIPDGIFELVASFLGYNSASSTLDTQNNMRVFHFELSPKVFELGEIVVKPDPFIWEQNFLVFKENMIGEGPFSESVTIKNPEVLNFDFDPETGILKAEALDRLVIENKDLGYLIYYYLEFFELSFKDKTSVTLGRPLFSSMNSRRKRTRRKWEDNRRKAYLGSFQHFTKALISDSLNENGFEVRREVRKEGSRYLYPDLLQRSDFFTPNDSSTYHLQYADLLNVTYTQEYEDPTYLTYISSPFDRESRSMVQHQNSVLIIKENFVHIHKTGYIFNPLSTLFDGYWGFERLSDMMPLDYQIK
jgi:hypothetical protein